MALGVLRALEEAGTVGPGDVAVVGFDDLPPARTSRPPLTTVSQQVESAGVAAIELLLERIADPHGPSAA
jgi:DNA-binding LacI/PurR family transcriptional regulator